MKQIIPEKTSIDIINFIKATFSKSGFNKAVIGVSGGVDSSVSLILTLRALGEQNIYPILLPYSVLNTRGTLDAMTLIETLKIPLSNVTRIDIKPAVDSLIRDSGGVSDNIRRGNLMARMRMTVLFDQAKKRGGLVVGTENKSEHLLGYFTRFGDEASDIEPLRSLYKTQVYELAKYLKVPENILNKPPSAELWPEQSDEGEFGFTYRQADEILYLMFDEKKSKEEIINSGWDRETVEKIIKRVNNNAFKHSLPYIYK